MRRLLRSLGIVAVLFAGVTAHAQLVLHLTFDNPGNLAEDISGNNHLTIYSSGALTFDSGGVAGGAAYFDASSYIGWGTAVSDTLAGSFSVALWIQTTQVDSASPTDPAYYGVGIVYADVPGQINDTIPIGMTGGKAAFMTSDGVQDTTIHTTSSINSGAWVHVVATYDISTGVKRLYINGVQQATETVNPTAVNARNALFLGANVSDGYFFNGKLDDFQFYSVVLSSSEVAFLHGNPGMTTVPEPSTCALLAAGLGLFGLQGWRRRRCKGAREIYCVTGGRRTKGQSVIS